MQINSLGEYQMRYMVGVKRSEMSFIWLPYSRLAPIPLHPVTR